MSTMVVVVMSYLLAAAVVQVLGPARLVFWPLRPSGSSPPGSSPRPATQHHGDHVLRERHDGLCHRALGLGVVARPPSGGAMLVAIG